MGVFLDQMVVKRRYLDEEELIELIALCSLLPGPTSTQTIVAIGHKTGGPLLGLLTMIVWACPVLLVMTALSFLYQFLDMLDISRSVLRYVGPMAAGFIAVAAFRIGRKVVTDWVTALLLLFGAGVTFFFRNPWVFPAVLLSGGAVMLLLRGEQGMWHRAEASPPWRYLVLFLLFAAGGAVMREGGFLPAELFERFYRYGYLVFGGGQVVVPLMFSELVEARSFLTGQDFSPGTALFRVSPVPCSALRPMRRGWPPGKGAFPSRP
jgi:chromate transporter